MRLAHAVGVSALWSVEIESMFMDLVDFWFWMERRGSARLSVSDERIDDREPVARHHVFEALPASRVACR